MARAKLRVRLPPATWIGATSRAHPEAEVHVHSVMPTEDGGTALAEVRADDPEAFVADATDHDGLADVAIAEASGERVLLTLETSEPLLVASLRDAGVPVDLPVVVSDGHATLEVTAPRARLSDLGEGLADRGLSFDVEYVREATETDDPLTTAQRDLLALALEKGYYETPRECTLTELADAAGVAKSTASERLHRAESAVIRRFAAESPAMADPP